MNPLKKLIQANFGSLGRFAKILDAPKSTIYSWSRAKDVHTPACWQLRAYIDAASYRDRKAEGWKCRSCRMIVAAQGEGIRPRHCAYCGGQVFAPVEILETETKEK